jgi:hypothetical protein
MTCYFRHLNELFTEVRVEVTKENKKDFDRKIHGVLGARALGVHHHQAG